MLEKSASFVLASLGGSTLSRSFSEVGNGVGAFPFAKTHCKGERPTRSAVCTSLASSLAAAALDGLFEHPARHAGTLCERPQIISPRAPKRVFDTLLAASLVGSMVCSVACAFHT